MVVLLLGSGGLHTNGREVSPSGLKPNSRKQTQGAWDRLLACLL
jgi:hypothetical protein